MGGKALWPVEEGRRGVGEWKTGFAQSGGGRKGKEMYAFYSGKEEEGESDETKRPSRRWRRKWRRRRGSLGGGRCSPGKKKRRKEAWVEGKGALASLSSPPLPSAVDRAKATEKGGR